MPTTQPKQNKEIYEHIIACNQESSQPIGELVVKLSTRPPRLD